MLPADLPVVKMVMGFFDGVGEYVAVAVAAVAGAAGVRCACARYNAYHQAA